MKRFWTYAAVAFVAAILGALVHALLSPAIPASVVATEILSQTVKDQPDAPLPVDVTLSVDVTAQGR